VIQISSDFVTSCFIKIKKKSGLNGNRTILPTELSSHLGAAHFGLVTSYGYVTNCLNCDCRLLNETNITSHRKLANTWAQLPDSG